MSVIPNFIQKRNHRILILSLFGVSWLVSWNLGLGEVKLFGRISRGYMSYCYKKNCSYLSFLAWCGGCDILASGSLCGSDFS